MRTMTRSLAALLLVSAAAHAAVLLNYNTDNMGNTNAMPVGSADPGLTVSAMTRGNLGSSQGHSIDAFGSTLSGARVTNLTAAVGGNRYVKWTVSPNVNKEVSYSGLTFYFFVPEKESAGVVFWSPYISLFSDVTGFTVPDMIGQVDLNVQPGDPNTFGPLTIDLSGVSALQGVTDPVEFRLYYHSKYDRGETVTDRPNFWENLGIGTANDNVNASNALFMTGMVIPEPAVCGLLGALLLLVRRRQGV